MASDSTQPPHGPPPAYLREGRTESPEQEERSAPEDTVGRRWGVPALIAWVTLSAIAGALWFAYEQGVRKGVETAPPLVKADSGPVKVPPDDPGGLEVPHQDKQIYERMAGGEATEEEEVRLRPEPEQPVPREKLLGSSVADENSVGKAIVPFPPPPKSTDARLGSSSAGPAAAKTEETAAREPPAGRAVRSPPPVPRVSDETAQEPARQPSAAPRRPQRTEAVQTSASDPAILSSFRVQLGAYRSADAAEGGWNRLIASEESLLGSLDHVVVRVDLGGRGIYYRLQAGPLDGPGAARAMCDRLQQRKLGCLVVRPAAR